MKLAGQPLSIRYGTDQIAFERLPRPKVASRILIRVHPEGRVVVLAPASASDDAVCKAVTKRARWIRQQRRELNEQRRHVTPRQYVSGESHFYLGKRYPLKVVPSPAHDTGVRLLRGKLAVSVRAADPALVRKHLAAWYRIRAREVFAARLDAMMDQALWVATKPPLRLQRMRTQWGNCSPAGRITLNPDLVKAPRACIDYVILHELCHHAEHNHSERFYRLMHSVMPDWEATKHKLDGLADWICTP